MYKQAVSSIPKELDECAYMDGASGYRFFFRIIFPVLKPITVTVAVLYFIRYWNDLMLPMILISKKELYTIPLSQLSFYNQFTQNRWNLLLASGLMAVSYTHLDVYKRQASDSGQRVSEFNKNRYGRNVTVCKCGSFAYYNQKRCTQGDACKAGN